LYAFRFYACYMSNPSHPPWFYHPNICKFYERYFVNCTCLKRCRYYAVTGAEKQHEWRTWPLIAPIQIQPYKSDPTDIEMVMKPTWRLIPRQTDKQTDWSTDHLPAQPT
jgi:hypothetical protein